MIGDTPYTLTEWDLLPAIKPNTPTNLRGCWHLASHEKEDSTGIAGTAWLEIVMHHTRPPRHNPAPNS